MKKVLSTLLIFSWFAQMHPADTTAVNKPNFFKDLPEVPPQLCDKIKDLSLNDKKNVQLGQGANRYESPRHKYMVKKTKSESSTDFRMHYSDEQSRLKNGKVVQNEKNHTYVTASMAANYMKICEIIEQYKLSKVRTEETYLILLDQNNPSYDDTNCVVMQELSLSTRIANKKDLDLEKLLPTILTLIKHADIWYPEKAFKVVQSDQELELVVSACMLPGSYGNFWAMSKDRKELFTTGCENLCNYFNIRDDPELANQVREFKKCQTKEP